MKKKRKTSSGHHERQAYLRIFFQNSKRSLAVSSLKCIEDLNLLRDMQKFVAVYSKGVVDDIEGCLFPKDYKQLCSTKPMFVRPVSLNSELVWFCSYAIKYFDKLHLEYCPECLSPIDTHVEEGRCPLCKSDIDNSKGKSQAMRIKLEMQFQLLLEDGGPICLLPGLGAGRFDDVSAFLPLRQYGRQGNGREPLAQLPEHSGPPFERA